MPVSGDSRLVIVFNSESCASELKSLEVSVTLVVLTGLCAAFSLELPALELPALELPALELPALELPALELPALELASFDLVRAVVALSEPFTLSSSTTSGLVA